MISKLRSNIDGYCSGRGLRDGNHVQHILFTQPAQLFDKLLADERNDDEASAKGECADAHHREKQPDKAYTSGGQGEQLLSFGR